MLNSSHKLRENFLQNTHTTACWEKVLNLFLFPRGHVITCNQFWMVHFDLISVEIKSDATWDNIHLFMTERILGFHWVSLLHHSGVLYHWLAVWLPASLLLDVWLLCVSVPVHPPRCRHSRCNWREVTCGSRGRGRMAVCLSRPGWGRGREARTWEGGIGTRGGTVPQHSRGDLQARGNSQQGASIIYIEF